MSEALRPAAAAFDAVARSFDDRFGEWRSVEAQRRPVRAALARAFPRGSYLLEIGGGTGLDAAWLVARGRSVLMTDPAPNMVAVARTRLGPTAVQQLAAEELDRLVERGERFDGVYSNFAAINCVTDLAPLGRSLGNLVRPGGSAFLVVFGTFCPGEFVTEALRGRYANMFRRIGGGAAPASLAKHPFTVRYHRRRELVRAMSPWFALRETRAIGLLVPPSAAEPWISRHPRLLACLEAGDRLLSRPLAPLGDHILYRFERQA